MRDADSALAAPGVYLDCGSVARYGELVAETIHFHGGPASRKIYKPFCALDPLTLHQPVLHHHTTHFILHVIHHQNAVLDHLPRSHQGAPHQLRHHQHLADPGLQDPGNHQRDSPPRPVRLQLPKHTRRAPAERRAREIVGHHHGRAEGNRARGAVPSDGAKNALLQSGLRNRSCPPPNLSSHQPHKHR